MSGLEVAAAVAAIVSGFSSGVTLFQKFRSKRKKQKKKESQQRLEAAQKTQDSLVQAGPSVQLKYGEGFAHIGTPFAVGDHIGRIQMLSHLATMQQSIVELLSSALGGDSTSLSLSRLRTSSETVRSGSIRTLIDQYQRLSVARTIPTPLHPVQSHSIPGPRPWASPALSNQVPWPPPAPPPQTRWTHPPTPSSQVQRNPLATQPQVPWSTSGLCPEAVRLSTPDATVELPYECKGCRFGHRGYPGLSTSWKNRFKISQNGPTEIWGYLTPKIIIQSHLKRGDHGPWYLYETTPAYKCIFCDDNVPLFEEVDDYIAHLQKYHTFEGMARIWSEQGYINNDYDYECRSRSILAYRNG